MVAQFLDKTVIEVIRTRRAAQLRVIKHRSCGRLLSSWAVRIALQCVRVGNVHDSIVRHGEKHHARGEKMREKEQQFLGMRVTPKTAEEMKNDPLAI